MREFFGGAALLLQGARMMLARPRWYLLGAIPALLVSLFLLIGLIILGSNAGAIVTAVTPFAEGWAVRDLVRAVVAIALVAAAILLSVLAFSTLTLLIGAPWYERISQAIDEELSAGSGLPPEPVEPTGKMIMRVIRQSVGMITVSLLGSLLLFVIGFVPLIGQLMPLVGVLFGSWLITIELLGPAFERRGLRRLADRRAAMGRRRWRALGFGVPTFLLLAVPLVAVLVFPAAAAGGTLLARSLHGEPTRVAS